MKNKQAIVFDMDDTLYPERDYVLSGFRAVAEWGSTTFGIDAATGFTQLQMLFETGVRGDTFNRWLTDLNIIQQYDEPEKVNAIVASLLQIYRQHLPTLRPFPEVTAAIPQLAKRYRLGLVSDGYLAVQQRKWAALNLAQHFRGVVFSDQWGKPAWKPSPKPFIEVLKLLDISPTQAVYVGDNPLKDFLGARQIGMKTIWLKREQSEYANKQPPTTAHMPDQMVTSWASLRKELFVTKTWTLPMRAPSRNIPAPIMPEPIWEKVVSA